MFSGIGAPEYAAPFIDWQWSADIDPFANAVRDHHWPDVPNLGDVSKVEAKNIDPADALVFGSPCQSFSVAGKRLGMDDPRGNLALVALGLVQRLRPRWFVFENVPGPFSSADGDDFAAFLRAVRECGYTGAWRVLDAQYFGVPQRRRRVFFVGHLGDDWRPSAAVLFEPESLSGHPPPRRETRQDLAPTISARPSGGGGLGTDFDLDGGLIHCPPVSPALKARDHKGPSSDGDGDGAPLVVAIQERAVSENAEAGPDGIGVRTDGAPYQSMTVRSPTGVCHGPIVRRLTPTECERLQGFPDGFTDIPWRGKRAHDGRRYKALGNSMAVPVMRWILERIDRFDREHFHVR